MTDNPKPEENLTDEFVALGKNLVEAMRVTWDGPERKRIQQEIETGLDELGVTLRREAENFASSPTGQQIREDVQDLGERLRTGEAQTKIRQEMLSILQTANSELKKVIDLRSAASTADPNSKAAPSEPPGTE